jgi:hypothetical protein
MPDAEKPDIELTLTPVQDAPSPPVQEQESPREGAEAKMEIHPIHGPVNSFREFFTHLAIITIGILIALSLEGLVEWMHHKELVHEARGNILTEVRRNRETIRQTIPELKQREDELNHIVAVARQLETDPRSFKSGSITVDWTDHELYSTAWKTASTSGAVTYMPYDELQHYTDAYDSQQDFTFLQKDAYNTIAGLFPLVKTTMRQDVTKAPRERFVQMQQDAYHGLLIAQALESLCQELDKQYATILNEK